MSTRHDTTAALEDVRLPVRARLAAAWTSFMFLYLDVDHFHLYKPGVVDDLRAGVVFEYDISPTVLAFMLASVAVPALMVVLSVALPARVNRATNLVLGGLHIPYSVVNAAGVLGPGPVLRPLHRPRGAHPRVHPALGLDLAPPQCVAGAHGGEPGCGALPDAGRGGMPHSEP